MSSEGPSIAIGMTMAASVGIASFPLSTSVPGASSVFAQAVNWIVIIASDSTVVIAIVVGAVGQISRWFGVGR